jgi:hypothetical protein
LEQVVELARMVQSRLEGYFGTRIQKRRLYVTELLQQLEPTVTGRASAL